MNDTRTTSVNSYVSMIPTGVDNHLNGQCASLSLFEFLTVKNRVQIYIYMGSIYMKWITRDVNSFEGCSHIFCVRRHNNFKVKFSNNGSHMACINTHRNSIHSSNSDSSSHSSQNICALFSNLDKLNCLWEIYYLVTGVHFFQ